MIGQLLIARLMVSVVSGKAAIFDRGLNGCRADNKKQILLDFSFCWLFFKQKQKSKKMGKSCLWRTVDGKPRMFHECS